MTTLKQHTKHIHSRVENVASNEQELVEALSEALGRADQKLLDDVRNVSIEHETRRVVILSELQALAARIGAFPATDYTMSVIENDALNLTYRVEDDPAAHQQHQQPGAMPATGEVADGDPDGEHEPTRGADWRQAAKNITDELNVLFNTAQAAE